MKNTKFDENLIEKYVVGVLGYFRVWVLRHDFGVWDAGFRSFDTILGFGVLVFSYHIRVWGFGFLTPN